MTRAPGTAAVVAVRAPLRPERNFPPAGSLCCPTRAGAGVSG
jgi:hypothetical protein